ncbi:MAG: pyridoxamine 5'-phosphate oxidase family protein [Anaerolineae bacterium]
MGWEILEESNPELAAFGAERLNGKVSYLATIRKDGSPRVHPMTPIIGQGHLFVFMEPTSPKGHDLRRDERYAIHCSGQQFTKTASQCVSIGNVENSTAMA